MNIGSKDGRYIYNPTLEGESWRFNSEIEVVWQGRGHGISVHELVYPAMSSLLDGHIYLDWSDVLVRPDVARMHLFPGADSRVSFEDKLTRMETWMEAVKIYDSVMEGAPERFTLPTLVETLERNKLPRPTKVVLDTGNRGLIKLLEALGFQRDTKTSKPFLVGWAQLLDLSKSGELIKLWREHKGK
jgi:hypothetical protein